jgi:hypothetical protein
MAGLICGEYGRITVSRYIAVCGQEVTDRTAKNDLRELEEKGFDKRVRKTRQVAYVLVP